MGKIMVVEASRSLLVSNDLSRSHYQHLKNFSSCSSPSPPASPHPSFLGRSRSSGNVWLSVNAALIKQLKAKVRANSSHLHHLW